MPPCQLVAKSTFIYKFIGINKVLTLLALSSSPHGNRLLNSIPVSGVLVRGSSSDASIITYCTLIGLFWRKESELLLCRTEDKAHKLQMLNTILQLGCPRYSNWRPKNGINQYIRNET